MALSCDRCEAGVGIGYGDEDNNHIRLQEMAMSFGVLTTLCFECRKAWSNFNYNHDLFKKYSLAGFRFKCWQVAHRRHPLKMNVLDGEKLLAELEGMEPALHKLTNDWIKAGIGGAEKKSRRPAVTEEEDDD